MSGARDKTLLAEARDEKTSEKRLAALAREHPGNLELMAAIAAHTNTAPRVLLDVAVAVPAVAVKHPAFVLQAMGGAASFAKFPSATVIAVLAHGVAPPELLRWVEGLRASWGTAEHQKQEVFRAALRLGRGESPAKVTATLRELALVLSRSAPLAFAESVAVGEVFVAHYRHATDDALRYVLGAASSAPSQVDAVAMLEGLGTHPRANQTQVAAVLARLLSLRHGSSSRLFEDVEACAAVAERVFCREDMTNETVLHWCSLPAAAGEGRDAVVRGAIRAALRRGLFTGEERAALVGRELTARLALTAAETLTESELGALAGDADYRVRARMASRGDLSADRLSVLSADEVLLVASAAIANPALPQTAISAALSHARRAIRRAAAAVAAPSLLEAAANALRADADGLTRLAVATRRDAPADLLLALARDRSPTVRRAVAKNLGAPKAALDLLAADQSPRVLDGLRKRPKGKVS